MMQIPCEPNGQSHWTQRTSLDGRDYEFTFDWNQRFGHWSVSIADQDSVPLLTGKTLVTKWPLLRNLLDTRRPEGEILLFDLQDQDEDPGFSDLGTRFVMIYLEPADLE